MKAQTIKAKLLVEAEDGTEFKLNVSGYYTPGGYEDPDGISGVQIDGFPEPTGEQHDAAVDALWDHVHYLLDRDDAEREDEMERRAER